MPFTVPEYFRVREVKSFAELASAPFADGVNALCWRREFPGDFAEVVKLLDRPASVSPTPNLIDRKPTSDEPDDGIITLDETRLLALPATPAGRLAVEVLLHDLRLLRDVQRDPVLNLIHGYPRDDAGGPVPTDVFSFHADSAPIAADTWLCTYHGPPSEGLRNEDAVRKIDLPAIRAELLKLHGGPDDESFREFLHDNHYDLHYAAIASAPAYSFGHFNLWRIACDYPAAPVPPCIHRAPSTSHTDPPRLLLIS